MNKLTKLFALVAGLAAVVASADPIQIAYGPIYTQPASNGDQQVTDWATAAIASYNALPIGDVPSLGALSLSVAQGGANPIGGVFTGTTYFENLSLSGYQYIVLSWGGSNIAGDTGTADYLYYINGTTSWTFFDQHEGASGDGTAALATGGLSGIRLFGGTPNVPDSGSTVALLGLSLVAVAFAARRKQSAA